MTSARDILLLDDAPASPALAAAAAPARASGVLRKRTRDTLQDAIDLTDEQEAHEPRTPAARPTKQRRTQAMAVAAAKSSSAGGAVAMDAEAAPPAAAAADEDDVDLDGLARELGMDLSSSTSSAPAPSTPAPRASLGLETMGGDGEAPGSKKRGEKQARRYFDGEDLSTKCYACGRVGHVASDCTNQRVFKPCWLCGLRGHPAHRCERELCFRCFQAGHQSRECTNVKVTLKCCFWCASTQHAHNECTASARAAAAGAVDLRAARCYVCGERGHLNCAPPPAPVVTSVSCSNCGLAGHGESDCREERMPLSLTVDNFGNVWDGVGPQPTGGKSRNSTPRKDWKADMECFYCMQKGHLKMDCPKREEDFKRFGPNAQRRQSYSAGGSVHRGRDNQDRRYSDYRQAASPFSRAAGRERDRERERYTSRSSSTYRRDRDSSGSRHARDSDRPGRSHDRSSEQDRHSRTRSAPPARDRSRDQRDRR